MKMSEIESRELMFKEIGRHLKALRIKKGVTQQMLSIKLGFTSAQYVSNVERGLSGPSIGYINVFHELCKFNKPKLCEYLGVKAKEFYQRILI